jgi:hypothetical protein
MIDALYNAGAANLGAAWPVVWSLIKIVALLLPAVQAGTAAPGTGLVLAGDALFTVGFLALLFTARRKTA